LVKSGRVEKESALLQVGENSFLSLLIGICFSPCDVRFWALCLFIVKDNPMTQKPEKIHTRKA